MLMRKKAQLAAGPTVWSLHLLPMSAWFFSRSSISSERCAREVNWLVGIAPVGVSVGVCECRDGREMFFRYAKQGEIQASVTRVIFGIHNIKLLF